MAREIEDAPPPVALSKRRPVKTWGAWAVGLFAIGFIFAVGRSIGRGDLESSASPPAISVDAADLDFGEAWESPEFERTLVVKNDSDNEVTIGRFQSSCACTSISPKSLTIPAHGTGKIVAKLDLVRKGPAEERTRDFSAEILPFGDRGVGSGLRWVIHGIVRRGISIADGNELPTETFIHGEPLDARSLMAQCLWPAARIEAKTVQNDNTAKVQIDTFDRDSGKFTIKFLPRDDLPVGRHRFSTNIEARDASGKLTAQRKLIISFRIVSDIYLSPDRILFGRIKLGDQKTESITVASRSGRPIEVLSVKPADGQGLSVESVAESMERPIWRVRQDSVVAGQVANRVVFEIRYRARPGIETIEGLVCYEGFTAK